MSPKFSPVPILMYHKVGEPVLTKRDTFLNVSAQNFSKQMYLLKRLGYTARTFGEVLEAWTYQKPLPPRTFVITFDDGYVNVGRYAAPILQELGFTATVFAVSQAVGKTNDWDEGTNNVVIPLMEWARLHELQRLGWEIAGHTAHHPHLDVLSDAEAFEEIVRGKAELEAELQAQVKTFCYPFGHLNPRTPELVKRAGFLGACTTQRGTAKQADNPFLLSRVKVAYRDNTLAFLYRLVLAPHLPDLRKKRRSSLSNLQA